MGALAARWRAAAALIALAALCGTALGNHSYGTRPDCTVYDMTEVDLDTSTTYSVDLDEDGYDYDPANNDYCLFPTGNLGRFFLFEPSDVGLLRFTPCASTAVPSVAYSFRSGPSGSFECQWCMDSGDIYMSETDPCADDTWRGVTVNDGEATSVYVSAYGSYFNPTIEMEFEFIEGWDCAPWQYGNGECDCGCGAPDPDCEDASVDIFRDNCQEKFGTSYCCHTNTSATCNSECFVAGCSLHPSEYFGTAIEPFVCTETIVVPTRYEPSYAPELSRYAFPDRYSYGCYGPEQDCHISITSALPGEPEFWRVRIEFWDVEALQDVVTFASNDSLTTYEILTPPSFQELFEIPGPTLEIYMETSASNNRAGFEIFVCSSLDTNCVTCFNECLNGGICFDGICRCPVGWTGEYCGIPDCSLVDSCVDCANLNGCGWCADLGQCQTTDYGCIDPTLGSPTGSDYTYPSQTCGCTEFDGCSDCVTNDFQDCIWCADSGGKCLSGNEQGGASERCTDFLFSELVGDSRADVCPAQCDNDCNGNGVCECTTIECVCQCYESYTGTSCELGIENAKTTINMADMYGFSGSSAIYLDFDPDGDGVNQQAYIFHGGYRDCEGAEEACGDGTSGLHGYTAVVDSLQYSLTEAFLSPLNGLSPSATYGSTFTAFEFADSGLYGGVRINGVVDSGETPMDVWFLDVRYGWLQACPTLVCSFNAADGVTDRFPSGSYGHATVNVNNTFYVFGGATADDNVKNELWRFEAVTNATTDELGFLWSFIPQDALRQRAFAASTMAEDGTWYLYGGVGVPGSGGSEVVFDTLLTMDTNGLPDNAEWVTVPRVAGANWPGPLFDASLTYDSKGALYLFGGKSADVGSSLANITAKSELWIFEIADAKWHGPIQVNAAGGAVALETRVEPTAMWSPHTNDLLVFGGSKSLDITGTDQTNSVLIYHGTSVIDSCNGIDASAAVAENITLSALSGGTVTLGGYFPFLTAAETFCVLVSETELEAMFDTCTNCATAPIDFEESRGELEGMTVGQMLSHDLDEVVCQFESRSSTNAVEDNLYAALVQVGTLSRTGKGLVANTYSAVGRCPVLVEDCPSGFIPNPNWEPRDEMLTYCSACAAGQAGTECDECLAGTIAPTAGTGECQECPPGRFQGETGKTACLACDAGRFASAFGSTTCEPCNTTSYQPVTGRSSCEACPADASTPQSATRLTQCKCNVGFYGDHDRGCTACDATAGHLCVEAGLEWPKPAYGWWASNDSVAAFLVCEPPDACPEGSQCAVGYDNSTKLCSRCAPGWFKLNDRCSECPEGNNTWKLVLGTIGMMIVSLVFVYAARPQDDDAGSSGEKKWDGDKAARGGSNGGGKSLGGSLPAPKVAMPNISGFQISVPQISISFAQILAIFEGFSIPWPDAILDFFALFSTFNINLDIVSPECEFSTLTWADKWKFKMFAPLMVLFWFTVVWLAILAYLKWKHKADPVHAQRRIKYFTLTTSAGYLLFLTIGYVFLAQSTLEYFDCTSQRDGTSTLDADPSVICWTSPEHRGLLWVGIFGMIVYVVGVPATFLGYLVYLRYLHGKINLRRKTKLMSFFILKYGHHAYYWEISVLIRKLIIVAVSKMMTRRPIWQSVITLFVLFFSLVWTTYMRPFMRMRHTILEIALLITNFMVLFSGVLFGNGEVQEDENLQSLLTTIITVVIAIAFVVIAVAAFFEIREKVVMLKKRWKKQEDEENDITITSSEDADDAIKRAILPHDYGRLMKRFGRLTARQQQELADLLFLTAQVEISSEVELSSSSSAPTSDTSDLSSGSSMKPLAGSESEQEMRTTSKGDSGASSKTADQSKATSMAGLRSPAVVDSDNVGLGSSAGAAESDATSSSAVASSTSSSSS